MSATAGLVGTWPSSDVYTTRRRRASFALGLAALGLAVCCAGAIVATGGDLLLVAVLALPVVLVLVLAHPILGIYVLLAAAVLFEQFPIAGLAPITAQSHFFQNVSAYTPLPIRLSMADLVVILTALSLIARRLSGRHLGLRLGPLGWGVAAYAGAFLLGGVIGVARGGMEAEVALNEVRAPLELCAVYFLAANLIHDRRQVRVIVWTFVALVGVKAAQAIINFQEAPGWSAYDAGAVTGHEDVVFFDAAVALCVAMGLAGVRSKLFMVVLGLQPLVLAALFLDQRRTGFIALGTALLVITLLGTWANPRRGLVLGTVVAVALGAYLALFWDSTGPVAEPIRAVRAIVDPGSASLRDQGSNAWRKIENHNIAFTIRQLPLSGVGLGQKYLFHEQPPPLYDFIYWQYITHNALLWLWLKAGPFAALALWFVVARALLVGSAIFVRGRDPRVRWIAALPVAIVVSQVLFSSVDLGLTYSRSMIVLGTALGMLAYLAERARPPAPAASAARLEAAA
jgi:hypothetical protein